MQKITRDKCGTELTAVFFELCHYNKYQHKKYMQNNLNYAKWNNDEGSESYKC
jgi:hypothetical protein